MTRKCPDGYETYDNVVWCSVSMEADGKKTISVAGIPVNTIRIVTLDDNGLEDDRIIANHDLEISFHPYDGCPIDMSEGVPIIGGKLLNVRRCVIDADSDVKYVVVSIFIGGRHWELT